MTGEVRVTITDPKHLLRTGEYLGLASASTLLEEAGHEKLPGFALASAIIEGERRRLQAALIDQNLRLAARRGVDIATHRLDSISATDIVFKPLDLAEMAEEPS